jgi:hypothetical protein
VLVLLRTDPPEDHGVVAAAQGRAQRFDGTPLLTGGSKVAQHGQARCCDQETAWSQVPGRSSRNTYGGYQPGGRCSVTSTGTLGSGR